MALVALSVVEQRLDAVRAVLSGAKVTEVVAAMGVSRQSVHSWIARYLAEGLAGLADKSHRPGFCPHQVAGEAEVMVAEMRRQHPKSGRLGASLEQFVGHPSYGRAQLRGDLERFVFLLGGSDVEPLFGLQPE